MLSSLFALSGASSPFRPSSTLRGVAALPRVDASRTRRTFARLNQAIEVSDKFLAGGKVVVYTKGRIPDSSQYYYSSYAHVCAVTTSGHVRLLRIPPRST